MSVTSRIFLPIIAVPGMVLASCTNMDDVGEKHGQRAVAGVQTFYLSPNALKDAEVAARQGNAGAALRLSEYHGFIRCDLEQQIYWMKTAVKLGARDEKENLETLLETQAERRRALKHSSANP